MSQEQKLRGMMVKMKSGQKGVLTNESCPVAGKKVVILIDDSLQPVLDKGKYKKLMCDVSTLTNIGFYN